MSFKDMKAKILPRNRWCRGSEAGACILGCRSVAEWSGWVGWKLAGDQGVKEHAKRSQSFRAFAGTCENFAFSETNENCYWQFQRGAARHRGQPLWLLYLKLDVGGGMGKSREHHGKPPQ